jgi:hypothetical protein
MIICFELKKRNKVKADAWKEMGTSDTIHKPEAEKEVIVPPADKSGAETASINLRTLFFGEKSGLVIVPAAVRMSRWKSNTTEGAPNSGGFSRALALKISVRRNVQALLAAWTRRSSRAW